MSEVESIFGEILRNILATRELPKGNEWNDLMTMVSLMLVRVPSFRRRFRQLTESIREVAREAMRSPEQGEIALANLLNEKEYEPEMLTVDDCKSMVFDDDTLETHPQAGYLVAMTRVLGG